MNKKIYTFFAIALLLILLIWEGDRSSTVRIDWRFIHEVMPLAGLLLWFLIFAAVVYAINIVLHKTVKKQLEEALSITGNKADESQSIDKLNQTQEKLVIGRADMDNAMMLLLKSMLSITEGDMEKARNHLQELQSIIGNDAIIDVLRLKIYKGEKDFDKMEELSSKLMQSPNLRLVSMKASLEAQMQKKEFEQALETANKAFEVRQDLYWVIEGAFNLRAKAGDWEGALQVLNSGHKKDLIPNDKYKELKAVTLYEMSENAKAKGDSVNFFKFCSQAVKYNPLLVPAALSLAEYYVANDNQVRKASQVLTNIWRVNPTTEIAEAYLNLWPDDSAVEKVQRMESLALTNSIRPSLNNLLLAELDMKAKLYGKTKSEFEIFLVNNPATKRLAKLICEYEKKVNKNEEAASNWKKKSEDGAEDSVWVCNSCGHLSKGWHPVCKKCGAVGDYKWRLYKRTTPKD